MNNEELMVKYAFKEKSEMCPETEHLIEFL